MAHPALNVVRPEDEPEEASARIWTAAPPSLVQAIEDYFYEHRFRTRSAAVRQLIEYGLEYAKRKDKGMI
jgi:metal-responsive CopG/Arc/MetJ family transcriptional regulator